MNYSSLDAGGRRPSPRTSAQCCTDLLNPLFSPPDTEAAPKYRRGSEISVTRIGLPKTDLCILIGLARFCCGVWNAEYRMMFFVAIIRVLREFHEVTELPAIGI